MQRFADRFAKLIPSLRDRYDAPGRAYHNWAHVQALLEHFERATPDLHAPEAVEIALYYHDVIYVPGSKHNEDDSADTMLTELSGRADAGTLEAADRIIRATASHAVPEGMNTKAARDCALFLDMDLAILGTDAETFDAFDTAIRAEFAMVPDHLFYPRRLEVMRGFQQRDRIYLTARYHASHDVTARRNLSRLVARLTRDWLDQPSAE